jgi:DNA repair exonuclease SbcCD ATPase subunit
MKKTKIIRYASLPVVLSALGVIGASCGNRQTQVNSATSLAAKLQNANNAGATTIQNARVSVELDKLKRELREATEFWKLSLAEESKERKAADADIRSNVIELEKKLDALRSQLASEIKALDEKLTNEFNKKLADQKKELSEQINKETEERSKAIKEIEDNLNATDPAASKFAIIKNFQAEIKSLQTRVSTAESELAKQGAQIVEQARSLKTLDERMNKTEDQLRSESIEAIRPDLLTALEALEAQKTMEIAAHNASMGAYRNPQLQTRIDRLSFLKSAGDTLPEAQKQALGTHLNTTAGERSALIAIARKHTETKLRTAIEAKAAEAHANDEALRRQMVSSNLKLVEAMVAGDNALREQVNAKINAEARRRSEELQAMREHIEATYAKSVDLVMLNNVVNGLSNSLNVLDKKVDDNDARLDQKIKQTRTALSSRIEAVKADVNSLRGEFVDHVNEYKEKVKELSEETKKAARDVRRELLVSQAFNQAKLEESIGRLNTKLTNTEYFARETRDSLAVKIVELERRDSELNDDIRAARKDATAQLNKAIAAEQKERMLIASDLKGLQEEVQRVSAVASQALNMSLANEQAIAGVSSDLKKLDEKTQSMISSLKNQMEEDLAKVRADATAIMQGLGIDTQKQFTATASQLAESKQKRDGLLMELGRLIHKGLSSSSNAIVRDSAEKKAEEFVQVVARSNAQSGNISLGAPWHEIASRKVNDLTKVFGLIESEFLLSIDYAEVSGDEQKVNDLHAMNKLFVEKVIKPNVCTDAIMGYESKITDSSYQGMVGHLFASVGGKEFWAHLARNYVQLMLSAPRSGDMEFDKVFLGQKPLTDGQSFQSALAVSAAPNLSVGSAYDEATRPELKCRNAINDWAKEVLFGSSDMSARLRKNLAERLTLKKVIDDRRLDVAYAALKEPAEAIESRAVEFLKPAFNNDGQKAMNHVRQGESSQSPFTVGAAQVIRELIQVNGQIQSVESNYRHLSSVAETANKESATITAQLSSLREKIAQFDSVKNRVKNLETKVGAIGNSMGMNFGMIAAMAARLGYTDLVDKAKAEVAKLEAADLTKSDPSLFLPKGCKATSHFFNYANEAQPLQRCDSGVSTGNGNLGDNGQCRTTRTITTTTNTNTNTHSQTINQTTNFASYGVVHLLNTRGRYWDGRQWWSWWRGGSSWQYLGTTSVTTSSVQRTVTTTSSTSVDTTMHEGFVGVLRAPWLSPLDATAQAILRRPAGAPFPSDRKTMIGLRIFGNAVKWKIEDIESGRSIIVNAEDFRVADTANGLVYEIPASMFLAKTNGQAGFTETAKITAMINDTTPDKLNDRDAPTCLHSMNGGTHNVNRYTASSSSSSGVSYSTNWGGNYYNYGYQGVQWYTSPIVLDLTGKGSISTVAPQLSNAMFDLEGTGKKSKVGWIENGSGLLALDLNGNGKIDSGRELFGDATLLKSGAKASNGYLALAQHDLNKDGVIDNKDKIYSKLLVWVDSNGDANTQKGELKPLQALGITGIGVSYEDTHADERIHHNDKIARNLVLYKGKFFGSMCPSGGCRSYDVYFGYDTLSKPVAAK